MDLLTLGRAVPGGLPELRCRLPLGDSDIARLADAPLDLVAALRDPTGRHLRRGEDAERLALLLSSTAVELALGVLVVQLLEQEDAPLPYPSDWGRVVGLVRCPHCRTEFGIGRAHLAVARSVGNDGLAVLWSEAPTVCCPSQPWRHCAPPVPWRPKLVRFVESYDDDDDE